MNKPEQLRLAADIIEKNLPWEFFNTVSNKWAEVEGSPADFVVLHDREIRIAPPPPEPVPLTAEDVPPGSVIHSPYNPRGWASLAYVRDDGVGFVVYRDDGEVTFVPYATLLHEKYEIKRPGSDTWEPCSK